MSIRSLWRKIKSTWYEMRWGIKTGSYDDSMLPDLGKGKFVSVEQKGAYIDITSHCDYPQVSKGMIRLIPYQPNHGVMVEFHDERGKIRWRTHCDYRTFALMGHIGMERGR